MRKHPIQNIYLNEKGVKCFVMNRIVRFLLSAYEPGLEDIKERFKDQQEDYEQFIQLVGCNLNSFIDMAAADSRIRIETLREAQMRRVYVAGKEE